MRLRSLAARSAARPSAAAPGTASGATPGSSTITFAGGGTLKLDATGAYSVLVAGFGVPDQFDFSLINFASATSGYSDNTSSDTLTLSDGTHSASILLLGNYSPGLFQLNPEIGGGTGTVVTDPPLAGLSSFIAPPLH
jgi:hypothetical protein